MAQRHERFDRPAGERIDEGFPVHELAISTGERGSIAGAWRRA